MIHPYFMQIIAESVEKSNIKDYEINAISLEVDRSKKEAELIKALEIENCDDTQCLLQRWQKEMTHMGIAERPILMINLLRIGLQDLHYK